MPIARAHRHHRGVQIRRSCTGHLRHVSRILDQFPGSCYLRGAFDREFTHVNRWLTDVKVWLSGVHLGYWLLPGRRRLFIDALLTIKNLLLEEFEVLAENLNRKAI